MLRTLPMNQQRHLSHSGDLREHMWLDTFPRRPQSKVRPKKNQECFFVVSFHLSRSFLLGLLPHCPHYSLSSMAHQPFYDFCLGTMDTAEKNWVLGRGWAWEEWVRQWMSREIPKAFRINSGAPAHCYPSSWIFPGHSLWLILLRLSL